ncbi:MAG: hypothetical protein EA378_01940 [Phycisphaerales bacterium]|nr:MAG: hypothetical protein EA378_01940 [Phycisphaerales bacterium]
MANPSPDVPEPEVFPDGPSPDEALRHLRQARVGTLFADEAIFAVAFVADGATGRLVFPVAPQALDASQHVLHVPEESDDSMQLLLTVHPIDRESHEACDRHLAYHGSPRASAWVAASIDSAKWAGLVFDGLALNIPNALREAEPKLVKRANADRDALRGACARRAGVEPAEPLCVGVDPDGLDVRARFGIVRVAFDEPTETREAAEAAIDRLLGKI